MRHPIFLRLLTITLVVLGPVGRSEAAVSPPNPAPALSTSHMAATLMRLPLQFEANQGQVDEQVTFLARGTGYRLFLTPSESVLVLQQREPTREPAQQGRGEPIARPEPPAIKQAVVRMKLEGANPTPAVEGKEPLPGIVNYFIGNDPAKWRTNIPIYAKVQYQEVYPGVDLAYYGNQGTLEYDFIVAPGADPDQIRLAFEGASDIHVADSGALLLATDLGDLLVQKPVIYQLEPDGHKTLVAGHYLVERQVANVRSARSASNPQDSTLPKIGIQLAAYDRTKPLVIDPVLLYSTYLGGSDNGDQGLGIAVDGSGQAYVTGITLSVDFPTLNASQPAPGGIVDAFVTKLSASVTNQPPVCGAAQANPAALWAPNHQLVPIAIMGVTDPDGDSVTITVTGVTQDEPVKGKGDGNTSPDAVIQVGAASVRAERSGSGNGHVYQISFKADDGQGSSCGGAVTVGVPHSQKKGLTAIDDGQLYTSTSP
ncbi:MAG: SBBP repeat-containing protein [Nitrospira sp.]|nr:SBBP repeat-containing protein [Nitrospira sp.]